MIIFLALVLAGGVNYYLKKNHQGNLFASQSQIDSKMNEKLAEYNNALPIDVKGPFGRVRVEKLHFESQTMKYSGQILDFEVNPEEASVGFKKDVLKEYCEGAMSDIRRSDISVEYTIKLPTRSLQYLPPPMVISVKPSDCSK